MRNYKRKTDRATKPVEVMQQAVHLVLHEKKSLREVCRIFELNKTSLARFMKRIKDDPTDIRFGYSAPRQLFKKEQECKIKEYLNKLEHIFHGVGSKEARRIAYDCAIKYEMSIPENWVTNKMPSRDWITAFLKRNTSFSLRKPETAKIKAMSFNKTNVQEFYTKLAKILDEYTFAASAIWNADETCVSTVSKLPKKTANKEKEHVAVDKPTGECGTNVTVLVAVSATGSFIPPMFIFPCEKFEERFIQDGPTDCIGAGNPSGCLTHDDFFMYMQHFIKQVKASKESPVLLILNNNSSSYISVPTLDLAEENGVIMLSIPRHCSQKMQPLDVGVYALLRTYMPSAKVAWMQNNAGKMMTIYDIPEIVRTALPLALEPNNIVSGFEKTGVFPCNENKFSDADYVSCPMEEDKNETSNMEQPSTSTFSLLHNILSGFEKAGIFPDNQNKFDIADDFAMNPTENEPQPSTSTSGLLPNAPQPSTSLNPQEPTSSETEVETIEVLIDPLELFSEK